jgi:hypothetical protein
MGSGISHWTPSTQLCGPNGTVNLITEVLDEVGWHSAPFSTVDGVDISPELLKIIDRYMPWWCAAAEK